MRPPNTAFLVHTADSIAFGPLGTLTLSLADVESLHAHHMRQLMAAACRHDDAKADREYAAAQVFCRAMEDHRRARVCELQRAVAL